MLDFYLLICALRVGLSGRNGMAPLDIPSRSRPTGPFFFMMLLPFTWTFQIQAGSVSAGGRRLELDCSFSHTG